MSDAVEIPGYKLGDELGRGAMGVVYRGEQVELGRAVALKIIDREMAAEGAAARFLREAQLCMELSHPHVIKVYDAGEAGRWLYLAMELVEGRSLDRVLSATGGLPPAQLLALMEQLADALDFVHSKNIVHRDIKPANIMLSAAAAKLMDFGLARGDKSKTLTGANVLVGSPRYLAPEAIVHGAMTVHADLYAMGLTFHEIATGTPTYSGLEFKELLRRIVNDPVPPPSRVQPGLPPSIEKVIMRLLEKDYRVRTQSAAALLEEIRAVRTSQEFFGTSWETSRAQLNDLASQVAEPKKPRSTAKIKVSRAVPVSAASDSFVLPRQRGPGLAIAGGLAVLAAIGAGVALKAPRPAPSPTASAPAVDPRIERIQTLHEATQRADQPAALEPLLDALERGTMAARNVDKKNEREARKLEARSIAVKHFESVAFSRAFVALTGIEPFARKPVPKLLEDAALPLPVRRKLYESLVFTSHVDDFLIHRCGAGPAFASQALLDPWVRVLESQGGDASALDPITTTRLHANDPQHAMYLFSGLRPVRALETLVAGPQDSDYTKREDDPHPEIDLTKVDKVFELHALTEDLDRLRYLRLDLTPAGDEDRPIPLVLRPLTPAADPSRPRILGLRVSATLVPAGRYKLRVRAYRLAGRENTGVYLRDLRAKF